jgi:hypothetical protein
MNRLSQDEREENMKCVSDIRSIVRNLITLICALVVAKRFTQST